MNFSESDASFQSGKQNQWISQGPKDHWTLQWKVLNLYSRGPGPQNTSLGSGFLGKTLTIKDFYICNMMLTNIYDIYIYIHLHTLPETNKSHLKTSHPKKKMFFEASIFRCDLFASGKVYLFDPTTWWLKLQSGQIFTRPQINPKGSNGARFDEASLSQTLPAVIWLMFQLG